MIYLGIAGAILATFIAALVAVLLILSRWHDHPVVFVEDPSPYADDPELDELLLEIDPPVVPAYVDTILWRGGLIHRDCLVPWLQHDIRPVDGCAGHPALDEVEAGVA